MVWMAARMAEWMAETRSERLRERPVAVIRRVSVALVMLTLTMALGPTVAWAQNGGPRVSGFFGTALGEGDPAIAVGGSVGYRFTPHFGFDFEVLAIPDADFDERRFQTIFDNFPPIIYGLPIRRPDFETSGHAVAFLTNFVTEFPTGARWLIPYVSGGGGVASVSRTIALGPIIALPVSLPASVNVIDLSGALSSVPITFPEIGPIGELGRIERSETDLALTIGGGFDFAIWSHFAVGADLRYLRLFGTNDNLDLTRLVGRFTYRF